MTKGDIQDIGKYKKLWVYVPEFKMPDGGIRRVIVEFEINDGVPVATEVYRRSGEGFVGIPDPDIFFDEIPDTALVWTDALGRALNYLKTGR